MKKAKTSRLFFFANLKVFYQIMIIIIMMIIFLIIQGFMSITIIGRMRQSTQSVLLNSTEMLNNLSIARESMDKIRRNIADGNLSNTLFLNLKSVVLSMKPVDEELVDDILESLSAIQSILPQSSKEGQTEEINTQLNAIQFNMDKLYSKILKSSNEITIKNNRFSATAKMLTLIILVMSGFVSTLIGLLIATFISHSLKSMESAAHYLASGDLSKELPIIGCPEVRRTVEGLNSAMNGLRQLVGRINKNASVLVAASNELKQAASYTERSAKEVAGTMEQLAGGSAEQEAQISQAASILNELSDAVAEVYNDLKGISLDSEHIADYAKRGLETTNDVTKEITELYDFVANVAEVIGELGSTSHKIGEITSAIEHIAGQITLLALNASIEAARAGKYGRGFEVVASETGKLADQSKQAAKHIADLIVEMKTRADHVVKVVEEGLGRAESSRGFAVKASEAFNSIFTSLMKDLDRIEQVAVLAEKMAENNEFVKDSISVITSIGKESAASTEEVSATAEEQSASVQEVTSLAENLYAVAENLRQSVVVFKIGDENGAE